ncbi:MAG: NADH-quinone oxidoreductase subunit N, partial [Ignavibacteria bacterium]|nr:NADH-quinone oxidoreductase subunit N [Ignavibacteria bacterium]
MENQAFINILPLLLVTTLILIAIILESILKKSEEVLCWLTVFGSISIAFYSLFTINQQNLNFFNSVHSGGITNLFYFIFLVTIALVAMASKNYLIRLKINFGEYYIFLLFSALGMMIMACSRDLIVTFLGLELMSINFYVLAGFNRRKLLNNEASLKYFLLGAFASGIFLYGIALIYGAARTTNIYAIANSFPFYLNNVIFILGLLILIVGFAFKVAAFPFHMWVPDVYEGSPTTVTALMSTGGKTAAFAALIVSLFGSTLEPKQFSDFTDLLSILSILSMLFGSFVAIAQTNLKRMLAYSSIAHAGYMLIGLASANKIGFIGVIFYLFVYTFMNLGAFILISLNENDGDKRVTLDDFAGLSYNKPTLSALMAIFMFALSGLPPFGGFFGKYYVFVSA